MNGIVYVLYSEELGVFLGEFLGLGFWSKLDPCGQEVACAAATPGALLAAAQSWESRPDDLREVAVRAAASHGATIAECAAVGLPAWDPHAAAAPGGVTSHAAHPLIDPPEAADGPAR